MDAWPIFGYMHHKYGRYRYEVVLPVVISTCIKCLTLNVSKRQLEIAAAYGELETLEVRTSQRAAALM